MIIEMTSKEQEELREEQYQIFLDYFYNTNLKTTDIFIKVLHLSISNSTI